MTILKVKRLKTFISGNLKDITIEEDITARSLEDAQRLAQLSTVDKPIGGSAYKIVWSHIYAEES